MKRIIITLSISVFTFSQTAHAKIWRVNNNTGVAADFNDFNAAISSASVANGDTIHVEASAAGYSSGTLSKRLVIIGPGYFFTDATPNPKTQANPNVSYIGSISFGPGSKGSVVSGLSVSSFYIDDSLITIQRCNIASQVYVNINNNTYADTIRQNVISGINNYYGSGPVKAENLIIYNNIFTGFSPISFAAGVINNNSGYFINNSCVYYSYFTCINFTFQNDIFSNANFGAYLSSNVLFNCIANTADIPNTNGNQINVNMDNVYLGFSSGTGYSSDGRYKLKAGSPAIGAGVLNGGPVDCGAFGGPAPYILSGMPSVPSIYAFTAPAQVSSGTTSINITVSSISH